MQPMNSTFTDPYAHHQTSQYYSHILPTQNPNPYPIHHQPPFTTDPKPPGVDSYFHSYHPSDFTYSHSIPPPPPSISDLLTQAWAPQDSLHQYGNTLLYPAGATVSQDVSQQLLPAIPTHNTWTNPKPAVHSWKKIPKKTKIAQSAWCEICKIACNTGDVLYKHKLGKKHIKNVEKLMSAASGATTSTATSNPVIGPVEKPNKGITGTKKKAETPQDLEVKRIKVLQGGAAAAAVRTCTLCNVVCNSDTVFKFHLAGQKHASMLKQLQQAGVV
ncbi:hypothetical protein M8C21_000871 [Ambrosia artemisiifolia]|uniref:U1-type domain-containing protein n=1 Tax=Ambrosia artemisiifolia TaxID=4212 RepID=A0AAD5CIY8_AMBAR|nr:hypothetical protein M8C21_000871 [Ambrosia artemisiifolia]